MATCKKVPNQIDIIFINCKENIDTQKLNKNNFHYTHCKHCKSVIREVKWLHVDILKNMSICQISSEYWNGKTFILWIEPQKLSHHLTCWWRSGLINMACIEYCLLCFCVCIFLPFGKLHCLNIDTYGCVKGDHFKEW